MSDQIETVAEAERAQGTEGVRPDKSTGGWKRIYSALIYSMHGLASAYKNEAAFRHEVWLATVLGPIAILLPVSFFGKSLMLTSLILMLIIELINSAIEWNVDYVSQETHLFAKRAKDMGSAAVFLSLCQVFAIWVGVIVDAYIDGHFDIWF